MTHTALDATVSFLPPPDASERQDPALRARSGILVLTFSRTPLYLSPQAGLFLQELHTRGQVQPHNMGKLPSEIVQLCDALETRLLQCQSEQEWNQVPAEHTIQRNGSRLLLRAFGLPAHNKLHGSQILILFERLDPPSSPATSPHPLEARLTKRQRTIVTGVIRGLSNRELAEELGISLHTVKEYLRQIMMRLNTTSRTGIVSRMAGFTPGIVNTRRTMHVNQDSTDPQAPQLA